MLSGTLLPGRLLHTEARFFFRHQWMRLCPHLQLSVTREQYQLQQDPFPIFFPGQGIARVLGRVPGALYWALRPLDDVTHTHRVLTSAAAPAVHEAFHDELLDEAGAMHGLEKDLMTPAAYRQALIRLGLPVLQRHTYAPRAWCPAEPALRHLPAEVREMVVQLHAACQAAEAHGTEPSLSYPAMLITHPRDRLHHLMAELGEARELDLLLDRDELRGFNRRQRAGRRVWQLLSALEALCQSQP